MKHNPGSIPLVGETQELQGRFKSFVAVALALFLILVMRLWYLQVYRGDMYYDLSKNNRMRMRYIMPLRGLIFDTHGRLLVSNRPSFGVYVDLDYVEDRETLSQSLSSLLEHTPEEVMGRMRTGRRDRYTNRALIKSNISWSELSAVETYRYELPGVGIQAEPKRQYVHPGLASHVLGYLGEISREELAREEYAACRPGEYVGKSGIERSLQSVLAGRKGGRHIEVDAGGREMETLVRVDALPGDNVYLTMDLMLQQAVETELRDKVGAVVAMDPFTGEILALASSPGFNPNWFVDGISTEAWGAIRDNPLNPLQNRATQGQYPPGSIFKMVTALAALSEGVATPETVVECKGSYRVGSGLFHCWKPWGHGRVDLARALIESCDVYFYHMGHRLGVDTIAKYARHFGFGERTGILLEPELPGLVPTSTWKRQRFDVAWQKGETLSMAIGQSFNLVTPLQAAVFISSIANGGDVLRPTIVRRIETSQGNVVRTFNPEVRKKLPLPPERLQLITGALQQAVSHAFGTGRNARVEGLSIAGKTGTVQVVSLKDPKRRRSNEEIPYHLRDHAWFVCFAPVEEPRIALSILVEHGGHGGAVAAPMAQRILEAWRESAPPPSRGRIALGEESPQPGKDTSHDRS